MKNHNFPDKTAITGTVFGLAKILWEKNDEDDIESVDPTTNYNCVDASDMWTNRRKFLWERICDIKQQNTYRIATNFITPGSKHKPDPSPPSAPKSGGYSKYSNYGIHSSEYWSEDAYCTDKDCPNPPDNNEEDFVKLFLFENCS